MDFILNETEVGDNDFKLVFSDDEVEEMESDDYSSAEDEMFIDDSGQEEDRSFYRNFNNREEYHQFINQTKNPVEVVKEYETKYFGGDDLPELFDPEDSEDVNFDYFESDRDKAAKF